MPDREQYGLRGSVQSCIEETTYPGHVASDGTRGPEIKAWSKLEYDGEGRLTSRLVHNADGSEWVTRSIYDTSGRTLKIESGNEGQPTTETIFSYSDQGRLLTITNSRRPDTPVIFRYDEQGRKTKVQTSNASDYRSNLASAVPPFDDADRPPNLPGGGIATTLYDEQDRPTEVQIRDSQGELVRRATRMYDEQGRIAEEHCVFDNPEMIIPAELRAKILEESGRSLVELRAELTRLMGGQTGPSSIAYRYDTHGRPNQTRRRVFNREAVIETSYNEHGDKELQITREKHVGNEDGQSALDSRPLENSEVRYSYEYDENRNWTKEVVSYRSAPTEEFQFSSERRRTLSYR